MKKFIIAIGLCVSFSLFAAKAPDFTVTDYNNKVHKLYEDYLNQDKVVVLKLFFVACPPCNSIAPTVQQVYQRWGGGAGKVEFIELSTQTWDYNANVKSYAQGHGLTFPGVGNDGGSITAVAPYKTGTYGVYTGTPTFIVIAPNGEVNFDIKINTGDQSRLDTAIAQALRISSGGGGTGGGGNGGGSGCSKAFSISIATPDKATKVFLNDFENGNPPFELSGLDYNCEFQLPSNTSGYYVSPVNNTQLNPNENVTTADIVAIQKYLLGLSQLNNMQLAVADVNYSGSVSAADMGDLRKLVLGITTKLTRIPNSLAVCHDPKNHNEKVLNRVKIDDIISKSITNEFGFWKYGDVSGAKSLGFADSETRSSDYINIYLTKSYDAVNENYKYVFSLQKDKLIGIQFRLNMDVSKISDFKTSPQNSRDIGNTNFYLDPERKSITLSWSDPSIAGLDYSKDHSIFEFSSKEDLKIELNNQFVQEFYFTEGAIDMVINDAKLVIYNQAAISSKLISVSNAGQSYFQIENLQNRNDLSIQLFTQSGEKIVTQDLHHSSVRINSDNLPTGLYFIKAQSKDGRQELHKIMKF